MELIFLDNLQMMRNTFLDYFFVIMTHLGDAGAFWIILAIVLFAIKKTRHIGIMLTIALFFSLLLTNGLLKNLVQRPRPFNHRDLELLIKAPSGYAFPSGHTTASFAIAFVLIKEKLMYKKLPIYIIFTVLAVLISFSRLYLYVHYPSDILAGILIGYICSKLSIIVYKRWIKP